MWGYKLGGVRCRGLGLNIDFVNKLLYAEQGEVTRIGLRELRCLVWHSAGAPHVSGRLLTHFNLD